MSLPITSTEEVFAQFKTIDGHVFREKCANGKERWECNQKIGKTIRLPKNVNCTECINYHIIPLREGQLDMCLNQWDAAPEQEEEVGYIKINHDLSQVVTDGRNSITLNPIVNKSGSCEHAEIIPKKQNADVENDKKIVCSECGGYNVHMKTWFELNNTAKTLPMDIDDAENYWCSDCQDNVFVMLEEDFQTSD